VVYIGIFYSVDFISDFSIVIGKPIHFGDSWLDPPVLLPSPYHNPLLPILDWFQILFILLISLNVRISRGLEQFHSLNLVESALVTSAAKDDWSRADMVVASVGRYQCGHVEMSGHPHVGHVGVGVGVGIGVGGGEDDEDDDGGGVGVGVVRVGVGGCVSATMPAPGRWPDMRSLMALLACAQLPTSVSVLVYVSQRIGSGSGGVGGGDRFRSTTIRFYSFACCF
jgi:hypothetical protein